MKDRSPEKVLGRMVKSIQDSSLTESSIKITLGEAVFRLLEAGDIDVSMDRIFTILRSDFEASAPGEMQYERAKAVIERYLHLHQTDGDQSQKSA